jgi:hypothetical protein
MRYPILAHFRHFSHFRHSFNYNIFPDTPFYAKQTQSQVRQKEPKHFCNNEIRENGHLVIQTKQSQFKANLTQNKPNSNPIKAKTNPIKANIKGNAPLNKQYDLLQLKGNFVMRRFRCSKKGG